MRILIFNFFLGIQERGIPIYAANIAHALRLDGNVVHQFHLPKFANKLPKFLLNILFVLSEQLLMPWLSLFYNKTIYPYNTVAIVGSFSRSTLLIVHDFIPNKISDKSIVARYVRLCQLIYSKFNGDVAFVSRTTYRIANTLGLFSTSRKYLIPNGFWNFKVNGASSVFENTNYVLLCTGTGSNKNLTGALDLYSNNPKLKCLDLILFGVAGNRKILDNWLKLNSNKNIGTIIVLPKLTDSEVVEIYSKANFVWIHSKHEGYGRSIAEARYCSKFVVASNIPPFREQCDEFVSLYKNQLTFDLAIDRALDLSSMKATVREPFENHLIREALGCWLSV